jgi:hypothetical protein
MARAIVVCALALLAACYGAGTPCGDGHCAAGTVCTADREHCVYPEQLTSCAGIADGTACDIRGIDGACRSATCLPIVCGDGFVQPGEEECDGELLGAHTDCTSLGEGYHEAGTLSCNSDCTLDRSACRDRCGDGTTQARYEACDVTVGTQTCESAGFHGGTLGCTPDCQLDVSSCVGQCGDGRRTSQEECDGTDFGVTTCNTYGYYGGNLRCTDSCTIEQDLCEGICGDGMKNGPEICDGPDLDDLSCQIYGFYGGNLTCGRDCLSVEHSTCAGFCGDGLRNGNELCDGLDHDDSSCSSFGAIAGALGCNAFCQPTFDACYWGSFRRMAGLAPMTFRAVWARSPRDVWASSDSDFLVHFDGIQWHSVDIGLESAVWTFWSAHEGYLWAHTANGEIAYHDGLTWTIAHRVEGGVHVAATTPMDVWAFDIDLARHFDGTSWSDFPIPGPKTWVNQVYMAEDGTVWLATALTIRRFDGVAWTEYDLNGLPSCIWGYRDSVYTTIDTFSGKSTAFRHDGMAWNRWEVPFGVDQVKCGGTDNDDRMWIAGSVGGQTAFVLYDHGAPWLVPVNEVDALKTWMHDGQLWTYAGASLWRLDGPPWTARGVPTENQVQTIWASSAASAWIGTDGHIYRADPDEPLGPFDVDGIVRDIWATDEQVWIGGRFGVMRYVQDGFERVGSLGHVWSIQRTSDENIWAAGLHQVERYDGLAWHPVATPPHNGNASFVGTHESNLWLRQGRRELRYDGGTWSEVELTADGVLAATTGPTDHWLFDGAGHAFQHDGLTATRTKGTWRTSTTSVWASSPRNVWVVANRTAHHFDGVTWSQVRAPTSLFPNAVAGSSDTVWIGGNAGAAYNLPVPFPAPDHSACSDVLPTYCNVSLRGHTAQTVDGPTDCNGIAHAGGELHYKIEVPVTGRLTARVTSRYGVDLSAVRADARGGCDVAGCVGAGETDTEVVLDIEQGQTYFLVVGAVDGEAPFTLDVDCEKL